MPSANARPGPTGVFGGTLAISVCPASLNRDSYCIHPSLSIAGSVVRVNRRFLAGMLRLDLFDLAIDLEKVFPDGEVFPLLAQVRGHK
jgi:hypothetical protein